MIDGIHRILKYHLWLSGVILVGVLSLWLKPIEKSLDYRLSASNKQHAAFELPPMKLER